MMSILMFFAFWITSIYNLQFQDIDGVSQSMNQYQGKKVLIVNIATGSNKVGQLAALQQLHQQYADSVTIIGFPSNSFGNEPRSNSEIKQFCQSQYDVTFRLASKNEIAGGTVQAIYHWLTTQSENGVTGQAIGADFQKFLIDREGNLVGVFSSKVEPLSPQIVNAIMR